MINDVPSRVVGVDLSLTATGVVTIPVARAATIGEKGITTLPLRKRFHAIQRVVRDIYRWADLEASLTTEGRALVVIEGLDAGQGNQRAGGQTERGFAWWWLVGLCLDAGHDVLTVNPASLKRYACGKGNGRITKERMLTAARSLTPRIALDGDHNRADAALLAALGCRFLGRPIDPFTADVQLDVPQSLTSARGLGCLPVEES